MVILMGIENVISGGPQGSVLGPLLCILYTHDMWFGLENMLGSYADDATLLARIPSPNMRFDVTESLGPTRTPNTKILIKKKVFYIPA